MADLQHARAGEVHGDDRPPRHETSDVNIRGIFGFGLGLLVVAIFIHFVVYVLFQFFATQATVHRTPEFPMAAGQERRVPPEPRLQTNPRDDLRALREAEDVILGGYAWVDKDKGVVRIPIDRAMQLTVQRGLPARATGEQDGERAREKAK